MTKDQQQYQWSVRFAMRCLLLLVLAGLVAASEPLTVTSNVWSFTAAEGWGVWWPDEAKPKPFTVEPLADGLRLTLAPGSDELRLNLWSERFKTRDLLGSPQAVLLDVEQVSGQAVIGLDVFDSQQEGLHFADRQLAAGRQTLSWEMSEKPQHSWGEHRNLHPDPPLGLWGLSIGRAAATTPTVLVLRAGQRREQRHAAELVTVTLDTGSPIHLLAPGHAPVLVLANRSPVAAPVALAVSDEDWAGTVHPAKAEVTVPANGTLRWTMPDAPAARGIHWIECAISDAGDATARVSERLPYAILDAPVARAQADGFLFGVVGGIPNPGPDAEGYLTAALDTVRWLALRTIRTGVNWEYVEDAPGKWNEAHLDWFSRGVDRFAAIGTRIQFLLCYCTRYAAAPDKQKAADHLQWMFSPPDLEAWRRYVAKMVGRYGDRVKIWEAWNEADIEFWRGTIEQYEQLLHVTHEEVKRGDPRNIVMNSGFAFAWPRNGNHTAEVHYRVAKESRADYDVLAYHLHNAFPEYRFILEGWLADVRKGAGDPPLLFNECAVNLDVYGERGQAEQLPKKLMFAWSQRALGYFWYNLTGGLRRPVPGHDANWGLMTDDFHPRAVFCSYHTLMGLLADATCGGRLPTARDRYAVRFDTPQGQVVGAWDEEERKASEPLVLAVGPRARCTAVDLMGVRHPLASDGGVCLMDVGHTPAYVLIEGAEAPVTVQPPLVHLDGGLTAIPGRTTTLRLALADPFPAPTTLRLDWALPTGFGPVAGQTIELAPGAARSVDVALPVAGGRPVRLGEIATCTLRVAITGTGHVAAVAVPVQLIPALPAGAFTRAADFVLAERAQITDLHANVPQRQHRNWSGPEDLSAQVWVGRQGDRLALRAVVRDDKHVQNHAAGDAWQGDALQVGFAVPGSRDFWEFTLARDGASGGALIANTVHPPRAADAAGQTTLTTTRVGDLTTYEASWPLAALGLDAERVRAGLAVDLLVDDDDGEGRDGWIELAPGLGREKEPGRFPVLSLE